MILLSILIALAMERAISKSHWLRSETYMGIYLRWLNRQTRLTQQQDNLVTALIWVLLPAFACGLLVWLIPGRFLEFVFATAVLFAAFGCTERRNNFRQYLDAMEREDREAAMHHADALGFDPQRDKHVADTLLWINFRFYVAVIVWYTLLGAVGAVIYVTARTLQAYSREGQHPSEDNLDVIMHVLDWIPVRIATFGYLLMGNFSRAFSVWAEGASNPKTDARDLLTDTASAAEEIDSDSPALAVCGRFLALARRTLWVIIVAVAALTIMGLVP